MALGFLRTRVGRRYLVVNLLSALVPLLAVGGMAYAFVRKQTIQSAEERVAQLSKSLTLSTLAALTSAAHDETHEAEEANGPTSTSHRASLSQGIPADPLTGRAPRPFTASERDHLVARSTLLLLTPGDWNTDAHLALGRLSRDGQVNWRIANPGFLWGPSDEALAGDDASYCVFESETAARVHCASGMAPEAVAVAQRAVRQGSQVRRVEQVDGYLAGTRDIYLTHEFGTRAWKAIVLQPTALVFAPLAPFRRLLVLSLIGIAILIFAVSHVQIRRTTEPLAKIREGTLRVGKGDFSQPVTVESRDEYGEVAASFNQMALTLDRQIQLLGNLDAIDRSALSKATQESVVREALGRFCSAMLCSRVVIAIADPGNDGYLQVNSVDPVAPVPRAQRVRLSADERNELMASPRSFMLGPGEHRGWLPDHAVTRREDGVMAMPLIQDGALLGVIAMGCPDASRDHSAECAEARRLADRVALALGHVHLMERLESLSAGTIVAFARAIDANSPWTAGHSERVTEVALILGSRLGLSAQDQQTLRRGGLLHDIGKIAVPASILDKAARLSEEEWIVMQRHPVVGTEILSPIPGFTDVLPLVRSHHERMDGQGYPDKLRGDAIPYLARVLAVADVFDALVSNRPYRAGLTLEHATALIREESGAHLDPDVVDAFLGGVRSGEIRHVTSALDSTSLAATVARARNSILVSV